MVLSLAFCLFCPATFAIADELQTLRNSGFNLPATAAGFQRGKVTDNETQNPGLGFTISYHLPSEAVANVYVYTGGQQSIPTDPMSPIVRAEFEQAKSDILATEGHLDRKKVSLIEQYGVGSPAKGVRLLCAEFEILKASGGLEWSFLCLTAYRGQFLKIRVTPYSDQMTGNGARDFAEQILDAVEEQNPK